MHKLRETQRRAAELRQLAAQADLQATQAAQMSLQQARLHVGTTLSGQALQHDDALVLQLQHSVEALAAKLTQAQASLRVHAREAKQIEKIVEQQRALAAQRALVTEKAAMETWVRSRPRPQHEDGK